MLCATNTVFQLILLTKNKLKIFLSPNNSPRIKNQGLK